MQKPFQAKIKRVFRVLIIPVGRGKSFAYLTIMKLFKCSNCAQPVYFENTFCLQCNSSLGFVADLLQPFALKVESNNHFSLIGRKSDTHYRYCANFQNQVCNWIIPQNNPSNFCKACDLNRTIPNITNPEYASRWRKIEVAKHRLIYQLLRLKLPFKNKVQDAISGIVFDFMSDENSVDGKILTGHDNGSITINIAEADDIEREMARKSMNEVYRSLLGHFRHEIGHYYFDRLINQTDYLQRYRQLFGDESADYSGALERYYNQGPLPNWSNNYISAYATAHPWEDWAETWAHYLHIIDTLETAYAFGLSVDPLVAEATKNFSADITHDPYKVKSFDTILNQWLPLTFALNSLNRSMGLQDTYPFFITTAVIEKMKFIHEVVRSCQEKAPKLEEVMASDVLI